MTTATASGARGAAPADRRRSAARRAQVSRVLKIAVPVLVVLVVVLGTKVVSSNSTVAKGPQKFDAATYGKAQFPKVQAAVEKKAVDASTLAAALAKSPDAATKQYGVPSTSGSGPEMSVKFSGKLGKADGGIAPVRVPGLPKKLVVRIQVGPAVNGTDLRDATGDIKFGQFTNQIDYQNAASALNEQLKSQVLTPSKVADSAGKTVDVVGVFQYINPNGWLVTPSKVSVS